MLLNPLLAWLGAAAVSVPIIIHLLNKRKFERVVWGAMRFLRVSVEQNQRRLQIEDLLLLALRCLLLFLLGLALARPTLRAFGGGGWFGQQKVTAVLLLDNSYSMSATDGAKSRFELAKDAADQTIAALPTGSAVCVLFASDYTPAGPIPEPTYDLGLARKTVKEAKVSDRATNLFPAVKKAIDTLREGGRTGAREVYLITDTQALGWKQFGDIRQSIEDVRKEIQSHVVLVGSTETQNIGVSGLRLVSGPAVVGYPLHFEVQLTNYGRAEVRDVRVKLRVDAEQPSDEGSVDVIGPGSSRSLSLFAKFKTDGGHSVTADIDHDHLPADDSRTLAVRALTQVKILVVDGDPGTGGRESESFYLRHALTPVPRPEVDQYYNKLTVINAQDLDATKLDAFDAVFLCNVTDFTEATLGAFADYLKRGGGLVFFPGENTQVRQYNNELAKKFQFLPATLSDEPRGDASKDDQFVLLQDKNFDHPISHLWNDPASSGGTLGVHFFRTFDLTPLGDEKQGPETTKTVDGVDVGRPRTVLRFASTEPNQPGRPAMMERTWGAGRVVLFASTADTAWNDLGAHPNVFVPLIHRTLGAIVSRQDDALNVKVGERFAWRADNRLIGKEALITRPGTTTAAADDANTAAEPRRIGLAGSTPLLTYDDTGYAGAYHVKISADEPIALTFAAQPDPDESRLEELASGQIDQLSKVADVTRPQSNVNLAEQIQKNRVGTELWKYLALIALTLATAETILAHYFSKPK
jgi:hypothetical protein